MHNDTVWWLLFLSAFVDHNFIWLNTLSFASGVNYFCFLLSLFNFPSSWVQGVCYRLALFWLVSLVARYGFGYLVGDLGIRRGL
jgi:hypothetical protein